MSAALQLANVFPAVFLGLDGRRSGDVVTSRLVPAIYGSIAFGCVTSIMLAFLWKETVQWGGRGHSLALLILVCSHVVLGVPSTSTTLAVW
jgi:hypothetical protein